MKKKHVRYIGMEIKSKEYFRIVRYVRYGRYYMYDILLQSRLDFSLWSKVQHPQPNVCSHN